MGGMVASAHPLASAAGVEMLNRGGNAFDAVAATTAALNVVEPFMSGLAGLGLATCYIAAERRVRCLDFIPPVPLEFDAEGLSRADTDVGGNASGVPGNLAGWATLVGDYGRKSFAETLAPAIALARNGFPISPFHVGKVAAMEARGPSEEWRRVYGFGGAAAMGAVLRQPDLAETLEAVAAEGPGYLYGGPLGEKMVAHLQSLGGTMSMADLEAVAPAWQTPITTPYRDLEVHAPPPPAESFQFLLTLRILDGLDLGHFEHLSVEHLDTVFRAVRVAAEVRIRNNQAEVARIAELLDEDSVAGLRALVTDGAPVFGRTEQWADGPLVDGPSLKEDTTSLSVIDAEGNAVCITQSLGGVYGSGVVIPGTGVCMNNFLFWGDLERDSANAMVGGGPLGMCLAPSISLRGGELALSLGTPGSYGILQTQVQAMVHYLDYGLGLQAAIEAPRARLWDGRRIDLEGRIAPQVVAGLREKGHDIQEAEAFTWVAGGMQAVARDPATGALEGAADPRRDGAAIPALG
jgi:gamma-glutamyltranspeptidase/glutathione hydrolase